MAHAGTGTGGRHALPIDGDFTAPPRNRARENHPIPGHFHSAHSGIILLTGWYFQVRFYDPGALALICFMFALFLDGVVRSAVSRTQTQAIQFSVFFLLPVRARARSRLWSSYPVQSLHLGALSAHPLLPRLSPEFSAPRHSTMPRISSCGRHPDHFLGRNNSAKTNRAVASVDLLRLTERKFIISIADCWRGNDLVWEQQ